MERRQAYSWLLRLAGRILKYFLVACFGVAIALALGMIFQSVNFVELLVTIVIPELMRIAALLLCFLVVVCFTESMRH